MSRYLLLFPLLLCNVSMDVFVISTTFFSVCLSVSLSIYLLLFPLLLCIYGCFRNFNNIFFLSVSLYLSLSLCLSISFFFPSYCVMCIYGCFRNFNNIFLCLSLSVSQSLSFSPLTAYLWMFSSLFFLKSAYYILIDVYTILK